ncbi:hypothetical protein DB41_FN00050 [Neochlamydia sp. TUME1]|uniref:hypothetical protein n=1 Tax=Neochlamydia sp. TUME1 TaxID=1478174 RepID=UPI00057D5310|nr:hypothetical protein [Neochlamydia sp. TUME1]KIC76558.1 hypothetical protein DB41_FN00050 [Neochlamydia sp. TUME1]
MEPEYRINGGNLANLPDYKVADLISENIPAETYTSIHVKSLMYRFPLTEEDIKARKVFLEVSRLSTTWQSFRVVLEKMLGVRVDNNVQMDKSLIAGQLLGNYSDDAELRDAGIEEVKRAYAECMNVELIISEDCNFCEINLQQQKFYIMAKKVGNVANFVIKTSLKVGPMVPRVFSLFK